MTPEQAYSRWIEITPQLARLGAEERELREILVEHYFANLATESSQRLDIADGWKLECKKSVRRDLPNKKGETAAMMAQLPPEVRDSVIDMKPTLKLRAYRSLDPAHRTLIDSVLVSKSNAPQLKLLPPKEEV